MPTLYLHIGMPKTGTTAVQSFFADNTDLLFQNLNIYYPYAGRASSPMHRGLFPPLNHLEEWKQLGQEILQFQNADILLSEENITLREWRDFEEGGWDVVRDTFSGYTPKIILYVRRVDDYVKSRFCEEAKIARVESYANYFNWLYSSNSDCLFVSKIIEKAYETVGKDNVVLRVYDKEKLVNDNIVDDFLDALDAVQPEGAQVSPDPINPSYPYACIPLLSKRFLPPAMRDAAKNLLLRKVPSVYRFPEGTGVGDNFLPEFEDEIAKVDSYLPGYQDLFKERPCSFSFPELDPDHKHLLVYDLLCTLLDRVSRQEEEIQKLRQEIARGDLSKLCESILGIQKDMKALKTQLQQPSTSEE